MKKVSLVLGIVIIAVLLVSFVGRNKCETQDDSFSLSLEEHNPFAEGIRLEAEAARLKVEDLVLIEVEEEVELGFDVTNFLPVGFDAYAGMNTNIVLDEVIDMDIYADEALAGINETYHLFAEGIRLEKYIAELKVHDIILIEIEEELEISTMEDFIHSRM